MFQVLKTTFPAQGTGREDTKKKEDVQGGEAGVGGGLAGPHRLLSEGERETARMLAQLETRWVP